MSIPWPRGEFWSNRLPEHATQLAKHLQAAVQFVHSTPSRTVELDPIKLIIFTALNFVTKLQIGAEDLVKELAVIKEGIRGRTTEAQKTAIISEEAKAAALEATAISRTTVDIAKDIKNKAMRPQEGTPMSYAAAAARGAHSVQIHEQRMPPTAPNQREIIVNIRDSHTIERLRAMNPRTLKTYVNQAITQSENEHITGITIMSAKQLKSRDLTRVGSGSLVRNPTYGVLVYGIRVSTVDMDKQEDIRNAILQDNKPFILDAEIKYIGWLTWGAPSKAMSSIIIEFIRPKDSNKIINEGLVWQGEMCQSERYKHQCRLKQYFKCQTTPDGKSREAENELILHNVYNPGQGEDQAATLPVLRTQLGKHTMKEQIALSDFNLHHQLWGGPEVIREEPESEELIKIMDDLNMINVLKPGTITFNNGLSQTTIDLCWMTLGLVDRIVHCGVDKDINHDFDHLPIGITLETRIRTIEPKPKRPWKHLDEEKFCEALKEVLTP
ncbi:uncharacterized protein PV09_09508 [Verruconis gallopava]|uniref:Endonuclease/exonuclease/phosphatase domain-containing protein n=1 Tax=Verruconis gallopava TaxID=253628 RepID=A0A0D1YDB5_9PEZI|nr:uncharacterized protein PV09_09508 [Verruconis gallopava]KIV98726.1 hypothetical protein PV09_09508 [Verruconis gallopava]